MNRITKSIQHIRQCASGGSRPFSWGTLLLILSLILVWIIQAIPGWGEGYARQVYPLVARPLAAFSDFFPFAIGEWFVTLSLVGLLVYPFCARRFRKKSWKRIVLNEVKYLAWIYVWFYLAWGLNYSQPNFYERTHTPRAAYTLDNFRQFAYPYVHRLNASYVACSGQVDEAVVRQESVNGYRRLADSLGIYSPVPAEPRAKTMLFSSLSSKVGVTGSMAPFFCEFTLNGDLLPSQYPATYAHELSHRLGIAREAEANFYAYQVCIRSEVPEIRFSGYLSVLSHVLSNAYRIMDAEEFAALQALVRPEVMNLAKSNRKYWAEKYSPFIGSLQDLVYDLYLKGNKIPSGRKNYSEVVGLLISYQSE